MRGFDKKYFGLILLHIIIGLLLYYFHFFPKIYGYGIIIGGILYVINAQNKNNEVLYATAYIVGSEVVLRMTNGNPVYEFSKFGVMILILIGVYFSGISKHAVMYWIFLILLIPGVIITCMELNYAISLRKEISFNISGPVCLGISSLYTYSRRVTLNQLNNIFLCVGLPVISCTIYLMLYTPNLKDVITGTDSNGLASGGFGPNQVSTVLGLGMFVFVSRLIFFSHSKFLFLLNSVIVLFISFRGLVTFSRGGMITGLVMIIALIFVTYLRVNSRAKVKLNYIIVFVAITFFCVWAFSSNLTSGLIDKRYSNQDAAGRVKESHLSGRTELAGDEVESFLKHPFLGVGVGRNMEQRLKKTGVLVVSHNEITRMLAEHGALGILSLIILFMTPLVLYLDNKYHIYLLCCLAFWLLTINHAAMRIAAPAFIYSLALLKVIPDEEKPALHRE
jgi:hypothetical protein